MQNLYSTCSDIQAEYAQRDPHAEYSEVCNAEELSIPSLSMSPFRMHPHAAHVGCYEYAHGMKLL